VSFDPALLSFSGRTFGNPILGDQLDLTSSGTATIAEVTSPGTLHLAEASFDLASVLDALQAGDFTLATLTFDALANGVSSFSLTINQLGDSNGTPLTAPEPGTFALFGAGLLSLLSYTGFRRYLA